MSNLGRRNVSLLGECCCCRQCGTKSLTQQRCVCGQSRLIVALSIHLVHSCVVVVPCNGICIDSVPSIDLDRAIHALVRFPSLLLCFWLLLRATTVGCGANRTLLWPPRRLCLFSPPFVVSDVFPLCILQLSAPCFCLWRLSTCVHYLCRPHFVALSQVHHPVCKWVIVESHNL